MIWQLFLIIKIMILGLIGHYIDQRRLDQPLYRTPWDDIGYIKPDQN